ncbi:hypothetical protein [Comamonas endophytica]|uniref:MotA/TolQ/ExbB proton channel family protein n=1 Tax=Comamonas endophytica TaxID=2949090 RepID=A0ABY6GDA3_9BURK|nr:MULTISPECIES: hypothetical protein [unclassified Acidovorax]MCD2512587.1 hypothetical protein [Acidovorax sp. D4N7]UYG53053.1 hypothetical protein M9799_07505 [Acidovorax sp. 5MLIR]
MEWSQYPLVRLYASVLAALFITLAAIWRVQRGAQAVAAGSPQGRTARLWAWVYAAGALAWWGYATYTGYGRFLGDAALARMISTDTLISLALFIGAIAWGGALMLQLVLRLLGNEQRRGG